MTALPSYSFSSLLGVLATATVVVGFDEGVGLLGRFSFSGIGYCLWVGGDDVGVVLIGLPWEISLKIRATSLPVIRLCMLSLPHILQKKFSSLKPTSSVRTALLVE